MRSIWCFASSESLAASGNGVDVLAGQARHVDQPLDIGMLRMNRLRERSPRRVISRMNRIARCTNPDAAVPATIE